MKILPNTTTKIQLITGSAGQIASCWSGVKATTAPAYTGIGDTNTDITSATTTDIVPAPTSTDVINVKEIVISNESATVSNAMTVQQTDGTDTVPLWKGTLLPGEHVHLTESGTWDYYAADGTIKTTTALSTDNSSVANQTGFAADTILTGSAINMPSTFPIVGSHYKCKFDMTKTGAGVAAFVATVRYGTAGTVSDTAIATFSFTAQTGVIDEGQFEIDLSFRTVGTGTSAVTQAVCELRHALAATGLTTQGTGGSKRILSTSAGFNSAQAGAIMSVSVNGGASFAGTVTLAQSRFQV